MNYSGAKGRVARYVCGGSRVERGSAPCLSAGGLRVDEAVVNEVLQAIQPAGIEAALEAAAKLTQDHNQKRESLALGRIAGARVGFAIAQSPMHDAGVEPFTEEQRVQLQTLGSDLTTAWNHPETDVRLRKRIIRTVLKEVILNNIDNPPRHELRMHWHGGVHTQLRIRHNAPGQHGRAAHPDVHELIRELSKVAEDKTIAAVLNRLGNKTGQGKSWHANRVANLRPYHRLPSYHKRDDWLTLEKAATRLGVSNTVVSRLIKQGILPRDAGPSATRLG